MRTDSTTRGRHSLHACRGRFRICTFEAWPKIFTCCSTNSNGSLRKVSVRHPAWVFALPAANSATNREPEPANAMFRRAAR